ncbi:hypothetical protein LTR50_004676 [Elasticomyces elasticus]|nr:hypothetical protein LTR50_004676 [Elasticomyces elasticus]
MSYPKSIFTDPGSFNERHNRVASHSARTPRAGSPLRRLSTPEYHQLAGTGVGDADPISPLTIARSPSFSNTQQNLQTGTQCPPIPDDKSLLRRTSDSRPRPSAPDFVPPRTPSSSAKKRPLPSDGGQDPAETTSKPARKKLRLGPRPKHTLDHFSFTCPLIDTTQPPSPLFFSNSSRPRPQLPPRFSSSEAAARMLSRAQGEEAHVSMVGLARGTLVTSMNSPTSAPSSTPSGRKTLDRASTGRSESPDVHAKGEQIGVLSKIGVIELLEQDERPTMIVDLADGQNYTGAALQIVFANPALRSYNGLLDLVSGTAEEESPDSGLPKMFPQFKAWLLSAAVNGESLNVCLPSFAFADMTWACSTLRRRLRIISGSFPAQPSSAPSQVLSTGHSSNSLPSAKHATPPTIPPAPKRSDLVTSAPPDEPQDYFGNAAPPPPLSTTANSSTGDILQTVEEVNGSAKVATQPGNGMMLTYQNGLTKSNALGRPTADPHLSIADEYVLRAASAGNVDWFGSTQAQAPGESASFDWTRLPISDSMPRHIRFARSIDWARTSLGPIEYWCSDLRQMCNLIMASPHPAAMYWGEELVAIYNEAYILLAGQKHPSLMGQSYKVAWAEIWDEVKEVFAAAKTTGEATMKDDDCLFINRNNYLEETYFSWSIIPMVGGEGSVMGLYNPAFEKTRRKIAERRMLTLREVGEKTAFARDVKGFWEQVLSALEFNEYDTPFVLLYSVSDDSESDSSSIHSSNLAGTKQCLLEGALGVPEGHGCAPESIDLKTGMEGFGPVFREVMKTDKPVLLEIGSRDLPAELLEGLEWRGFGDAARAVVVCPIHPTTGEAILGFLVLGINPRRPYDDDYSLFVQLLSRQLATSLASVVLFEEEIRRGRRAAKLAALDRIELSEQLAARTQEAIESETKFTRMAEFAPVGMFIANSEGRITYCNDTWYEISRVPKDEEMTDRWMDAVKDEDKALVKNLWNDLVVNTKPITAEFRFKAPWEDRNGHRADTWVLFSAYPERYESGTLKSVFGSITNISQQKWAEGFQKRKMEEAVELKRQQENFIDITSHEMRNPLSAILQCADEISTLMTEYKKSRPDDLPTDLVNSSLDAAQTIALCAQHQKRIVDDVLTLSKLDSAMLLVTPVDAQPLHVVQRALKMFEGELQNADIQMKFVVDDSFRKLDIDWVRFDPSRVLQVLINLTTNAIKFTTTESKRTISVSIAASLEPPSKSPNRVVNYFPTRSKRATMTEGRDWGTGEVVYVHFAVRDTGRGLSEEEKKLLFLRFSQASPRTHVQYGGSGLGLFISRELTELQGGEIGVASEAGKGSTFAFYVKARRSAAPAEAATAVVGRNATDAKSTKDKAAATMAKTAKAGDKLVVPSPSTRSPSPKSKSESERLKVLIVEDNLVNQRVLQKQLKNLGCVVHVANHGGEALEKLRQSNYWSAGPDEKNGAGKERIELSVVLMDQEMPVMDGLTCTRKIRELEKEGKFVRHVPIIAVTANARGEQIQTALNAGMDDVVSKPFRIPDLIPKIEELLEKYRDPSPSL